MTLAEYPKAARIGMGGRLLEASGTAPPEAWILGHEGTSEVFSKNESQAAGRASAARR
jgi:hypothetical protein